MTDAQVELMVREFTDELIKWSEGVSDYCEVARGLESIHIRLQVWTEVYQAGNGAGKKHHGWVVSVCRDEAGGARGPTDAGTAGKSGVVRWASG